jgi:hypothetical protein
VLRKVNDKVGTIELDQHTIVAPLPHRLDRWTTTREADEPATVRRYLIEEDIRLCLHRYPTRPQQLQQLGGPIRDVVLLGPRGWAIASKGQEAKLSAELGAEISGQRKWRGGQREYRRLQIRPNTKEPLVDYWTGTKCQRRR